MGKFHSHEQAFGNNSSEGEEDDNSGYVHQGLNQRETSSEIYIGLISNFEMK